MEKLKVLDERVRAGDDGFLLELTSRRPGAAARTRRSARR